MDQWLATSQNWGYIFLAAGVGLILWDIIMWALGKKTSGEVQQAKAAVDDAIAKQEALLQNLNSQVGIFDVDQQYVVQGFATAAEETKDVLKKAKEALGKVFEDALATIGKSHPMLVLGAGLIVIAAGVFGAKIPFVSG